MLDLFVLDDSAAIFLVEQVIQSAFWLANADLISIGCSKKTSFQASWENAKLLNMGVSKNRGKTPKWMVKNHGLENPIRTNGMIWGG